MFQMIKAIAGPLFALALLYLPAVALAAEGESGSADCNLHSSSPGCVPAKTEASDNAQSPTAPESDSAKASEGPSLRNSDSKPPPSSGAASQQHAAEVSKNTGDQYATQGQIQNTHTSMTGSGSSGSSSVGSMDLVEAILILPFNPKRAGKLLTSGKQAHEAAKGLDAVAAKAQKNAKLMQAADGSDGTAANQPGSTPAAQKHGTTSASGPAEARAGELYGQLEEKYGLTRDDFEAEAKRVNGDPEAVGTFMQELTGDKAVGKDAVNAALESYAAEIGVSRSDLFKHTPAADFAVSEAPKASPSAPQVSPTAPSLINETEADRKLAAAKEGEKKESIRDKMRKALAERRAGRPGEEKVVAETLAPLKDQFFEKLKAEHDKELSLFDVVRAKYIERRQMLERMPGAQ